MTPPHTHPNPTPPRPYKTSQRQALLAFLHRHPHQPLSARTIATALAKNGKNPISISAIYRNLAAMEQEGLLRASLREGSREKYWQFTAACPNHLHLACVACGRISHLNPAALSKLAQTLARNGFDLLPSQTTLYGECAACRHHPHP